MIDSQNRTVIPLEWDILDINYDNDLIFCGIQKEAYEVHVGEVELMQEAISYVNAEPTWYSRLKWGVYDKNGNLIVEPELDNKPTYHEVKHNPIRYMYHKKYYILKRKRKYGVLCEDGRLITDISLLKREAIFLINVFSK